MDGGHQQPNYIAIAGILAMLYLAVKHFQMSKQLGEVEGLSAWLYHMGGYAAYQQPQIQQQPQKRGAPKGYEGPSGSRRSNQDDQETVRDRSFRRQDRPIQDSRRGGGSGSSSRPPADDDYEFLEDKDKRFLVPGKR